MAHATKDLNPTLSQFVSFVGIIRIMICVQEAIRHIYMNQYPNRQGGMSTNIAPEILSAVVSMIGMSEETAAKKIVFYVYAVMCSQVYLDDFEGALFTVESVRQEGESTCCVR